MSPSIDDEGEMSHHPPTLDEATTEVLLTGRIAELGRHDLEPLATFVDDMRALARDPAPAPSHALAAVFAHGRPSAADVSAAQPAVKRPSRLLPRAAAKLAGAGLVVKVGLGATVAAASVTAAGAAGVLPGTAQNAVAGVVRTVTPFHFPQAGAAGGVRPPTDGVATDPRSGVEEPGRGGEASDRHTAVGTDPAEATSNPSGAAVEPPTRVGEPVRATPHGGGAPAAVGNGPGQGQGKKANEPDRGANEDTSGQPADEDHRGPSPGAGSGGQPEPAESHRHHG